MVRWSVVFAVLTAAALGGCSGASGDADANLLAQIAESEAQFRRFVEADADVDWLDESVQSVVGELLRGYAAYANGHRNDSLSVAFLMRRADLLQGKGDAEGAVAQWIDIAEGFPKSASAPEAIFCVGFARESALRDTAGALEAYGELVKAYPQSPWAEQATLAAKWLSFDEKAIIRALDGE